MSALERRVVAKRYGESPGRIDSLPVYNSPKEWADVMAYLEHPLRVVIRAMGLWDVEDDVLQDTFVRIRTSAHTYRGDGLLVWAKRIVSNLCYDEYRRRQRKATRLATKDAQGAVIDDAWIGEHVEDNINVEEQVVNEIGDQETVAAILSDLSPREKKILELYYLEHQEQVGLRELAPFVSIANANGEKSTLGEIGAKSLLFRARKSARKVAKEKGITG